MKTVLFTIALAGVSVSLLAQGTITFNNNGGGGTSAYRFPIYGPEMDGFGWVKTGNTSAGAPPGTQVYTGAMLAGSDFSAQLFAGPAGTPEANLVACLPISTFRTGTAAGFLPVATATVPGVAGDTVPCAVQLRVWYNHGGQYATWAQAQAAWMAGLTSCGMSATLNLSAIGGALVTPPTLSGMQSFNLYRVPEPTTMTLAGLGLVSWLVFCRRK